jgi:hypothetical protein
MVYKTFTHIIKKCIKIFIKKIIFDINKLKLEQYENTQTKFEVKKMFFLKCF